MKLSTIIGAAIAAVGLAACGSTVAPTASPTRALTVAPALALTVAPTLAPTPTVAPTPTATPAPTPNATPIPTPPPSESPSPSASASPSPTEGPCGYQPCGTGVGWDTTCAVPGTTQGLIVTWTAGVGQTAPVVPDTITVDGTTTLDVTSNPFTSGPYSIGNHSFTYPGSPEGPNGGSSLPFTVSACAAVTVTTTCSRVTFAGVIAGDLLFVDGGVSNLITSDPYSLPGMSVGTYTFTIGQPNDGSVITVFTGTFTIADLCARYTVGLG